MLEVINIKKYFMWEGGIIIVLTIVLSTLSGLYSDYFYCKDHQTDLKEELQNRPIPGTTLIEAQMDYMKNMEIRMMCSSVNSNIYMSYLVIIVGVALLVGGFITEKFR